MTKKVPLQVCKSSPLGMQKFPSRYARPFGTISLAGTYRGQKSLYIIIYSYYAQCASVKRRRLSYKEAGKEKNTLSYLNLSNKVRDIHSFFIGRDTKGQEELATLRAIYFEDHLKPVSACMVDRRLWFRPLYPNHILTAWRSGGGVEESQALGMYTYTDTHTYKREIEH